MPSGIYKRIKENKGLFKKGVHYNLGKKLSNEHKEKLSISHKGNILSEEHKIKIGLSNKGRKSGMRGKHHSLESKDKIGKSNSGKKSHFWKDGRSGNKNYVSWRKNKRNRVLKRINKNGSSHTWGDWETLKAQYNWTCLCCKRKEPEIKLTEDHIIPLSRGGSDNIENIQPLCQKCNSKKLTHIIKFQ